MHTDGAVRAAFLRVQAIHWETLGAGPKDDRLTELMRAFVTGIRAWAAQLETGQRHVFDNLARHIDPTIALPSHMEEWLIELLQSDRIQPWRGRHYAVRGLHAYLSWTQLDELERVPDVDLPDPYEPLIQFFGGAVQCMWNTRFSWISIRITSALYWKFLTHHRPLLRNESKWLPDRLYRTHWIKPRVLTFHLAHLAPSSRRSGCSSRPASSSGSRWNDEDKQNGTSVSDSCRGHGPDRRSSAAGGGVRSGRSMCPRRRPRLHRIPFIQSASPTGNETNDNAASHQRRDSDRGHDNCRWQTKS